jgi:hypothetical protein
MPYLQPICLVIRGTIRVARGDVEGLNDTAESLELARGIRDPQVLFPALGYHSAALLAAGRSEEAVRCAGELQRMWQEGGSRFLPADWFARLADVLTSVGRSDDVVQAAKAASRTRWLDAALALAAGDFVGAADTYAEIGSRPDEAYARLRDGSEPQVRRALDFYRSVGATRYIGEGEALLAATA